LYEEPVLQILVLWVPLL